MESTSLIRSHLSKIDLDPGYISKFFKDQSVRDFIIKNNSKNILDIGCDTGYMNKLLLESKHENAYIGIDCRNSIINDNLGKNGKFIQTNNLEATINSLKDIIFDIILMLDIIEHFNNKEDGIKHFNKISNLNHQYLILSTPNSMNNFINWPKYHNYEYSYTELEKIITLANYRIIACHGWSMSNEVHKSLYKNEFEDLPIEIQRVLTAWNNYRYSRDIIYFLKKN